MNPNRDVLPDSAVAVRGDEILAIGDTKSLTSRYEAGETLDARRHLVMPGLINTHTHLATVALRGLAEDLPLGPWLREVGGRRRRSWDRPRPP
jgi:5-methylthioadenosine/S-adenosylhomocysteine deaminase